MPRGYLGWGKSTQLGTGLGLAMGARLARPDWLAVNIMGDAAFGMVGMDFETAVRCRIPILTIVLNNGLMGGYTEWMPDAVERYAAEPARRQLRRVATALGGHAERVERPADLRAGTRALHRERRRRAGGTVRGRHPRGERRWRAAPLDAWHPRR